MAIKKDTKVKKTTTNTKRSDIKEITNGALIILIILSGAIGVLVGWLLSYIFYKHSCECFFYSSIKSKYFSISP